VYRDYGELHATPGVTSVLPLGLPDKAKTVRVTDGKTQATEGPLMGANGAIGHYLVVEADTIDDVVELAARIPAARHGGAVEVRPIETYW
jgi:hypothetical protein